MNPEVEVLFANLLKGLVASVFVVLGVMLVLVVLEIDLAVPVMIMFSGLGIANGAMILDFIFNGSPTQDQT